MLGNAVTDIIVVVMT